MLSRGRGRSPGLKCPRPPAAPVRACSPRYGQVRRGGSWERRHGRGPEPAPQGSRSSPSTLPRSAYDLAGPSSCPAPFRALLPNLRHHLLQEAFLPLSSPHSQPGPLCTLCSLSHAVLQGECCLGADHQGCVYPSLMSEDQVWDSVMLNQASASH